MSAAEITAAIEQLPAEEREQVAGLVQELLATERPRKETDEAARQRAINRFYGAYRDKLPSVDEFLRRKHDGLEREEARSRRRVEGSA